MNYTDGQIPRPDQELPGTGNRIESRAGLAGFDATTATLGGAVVGFCASKFGLDRELSANLVHGGILAAASGVITGAISYIRRG